MNDKKLSVLGIVAVVMLVAAILVGRLSRSKPQPSIIGAKVIQGLDPAKVATIELGKADSMARLIRQETHYVVGDKDNYPAANKEVNKLLTDCLDITIAEKVTSNPDNHADLGVTEEKASHLIRFLDAQGELITGLAIGDRATGVQGTYVRMLPANDVYLSSNVPYLRTGALDYVDKAVFSVDTKKIKSVEVIAVTGGYVVTADEAGTLVLVPVPDPCKPKDTEVRTVFEALRSINFNDVSKQSAESELAFDNRYVCTLNDSTVYTVAIAKNDDNYYVSCVAEFTDTTPVTMQRGVQEAPEELAKKEAKLLARQSVEEFNKKHQGWVYELASWQGDKLVKKLADLLEPKEEQQPESDDEPDAAEQTAPTN